MSVVGLNIGGTYSPGTTLYKVERTPKRGARIEWRK